MILIAAFMIFCVAGNLQADVIEFPAANLQFDLPDNWRSALNTTGAPVLVARNPDSTVTMFCWLGPPGAVQAIGNNLPTILAGFPANCTNVRIAKSSSAETINDFDQLWYAGRADFKQPEKDAASNQRFLASAIDAKGTAVIIAAFGNISGVEDVVQAAFRSVKTIDHSTSTLALRAIGKGFKAFSPYMRFTYFLRGAVVLCLVLALIGKVPIRYNIRSLTVRWKTTLMTALAFTMVVALLTVMLAFVNGMYRLTESSGKPENVIVLSDGATDENFSNLGFSDSSDVALQPGILRNKSGMPLASREVYIVVNQAIKVAENEKPRRRFVQVRGIEEPEIAGEVHGMTMTNEKGRWFSASGIQAQSDPKSGNAYIEAVLGQGLAAQFGKDVGKPTLEVGDVFELGSRQWVVVGIMKSGGSTFDSEVWAKHSVVSKQYGKETFSSITVKTESPEWAKRLATLLTTDFKKASLQAQVETEYFEKLSATNQQFLYAIILVATIMAIGGALGVMNTMLAAVSQRSKDIGVLRILGYSRRQVLYSFLLESLLLGLIGGLIGCALGSLCHGWTANSIVSGGSGGGRSVVLALEVTPLTLAGGLFLALNMGLIGGLIPALAAMRKRPLETLR